MAISGSYSTGDEISFNDAVVEVDLTPASPSWAQIETWATSVTVTGGETPTGETNTLGQEGPIIFVGKNGPWDVQVECLYTEAATAPFANIYAAHVASGAKKMDVRWVPKGSTATTDYRFLTVGGKITACTLPQGNASAAAPSVFSFTIRCQSITQQTAS